MLFFIWSIKVQIPFVSVNLFCPLVGIIWFISDSYGFGKLYMILNVMCFINEIVTIIVYSIISAYVLVDNKYDTIVKNIISFALNISLNVLIIFISNKAITLSKKLSFKKYKYNKSKKI